MKRWLPLAAVATALVLSTPSFAQLRAELGRFEFESNCVSCHGAGGRGDGAYAANLKLAVPDLTTLTVRNNGVFPAERVQRIIDGREDLKGHGPRAMPIWGAHYNERAAEYYKGFAHDPEAYTRVRVLSLVDYVYSMQSRR